MKNTPFSISCLALALAACGAAKDTNDAATVAGNGAAMSDHMEMSGMAMGKHHVRSFMQLVLSPGTGTSPRCGRSLAGLSTGISMNGPAMIANLPMRRQRMLYGWNEPPTGRVVPT